MRLRVGRFMSGSCSDAPCGACAGATLRHGSLRDLKRLKPTLKRSGCAHPTVPVLVCAVAYCPYRHQIGRVALDAY